MSTRNLEMRFQNDENRTVTVRVPNPREDVTAEEISTVMDDILTHNVLSGTAHTIHTKVGARIVSRDIEDIAIP
ncbi:DUF2922 domain-containing protein [Alteribacillus iranensis]|uniref:DUF2922 domain-containing protein n=1 Tax=Alteribacillus iranensis TaxID=930128 RepID=A0A1I2BU51_9BACI|nr:DUF2922 domain-containing protein [Alteribacillus iranensis]SFE59448.1 Protein of unknown function [Alteribacillus iranensis]